FPIMNSRLPLLLLTAVLYLPSLGAQTRNLVATDPVTYAVTYIEVAPAARAAASAAFRQYADASRKAEGYLAVNTVEQVGRPGHFVVLEKWADQKTFDAHSAADHTKDLLKKLEPIRLGYDQR